MGKLSGLAKRLLEVQIEMPQTALESPSTLSIRDLPRVALVCSGIGALLLAAGFFLQSTWATNLWPLPASRLSNIFVSSILAAEAAPVIWIGLTGELGAIPGGAINLAVTYSAIAVFALRVSTRGSADGTMVRFGIASAVLASVSLIILACTRNFPLHDTRATPLPVRISFALFALVLLLVGAALALERPNIFPWQLSAETSVIYGWIFLGAMCYFAYALARPYWGNACGQLLGFLFYDLVLIEPYLKHFQSVKPQLRLNLIIYTTVIIYSGLLAIYYVFVHRETRTKLSRWRKELA
jgi:hypothetical protein